MSSQSIKILKDQSKRQQRKRLSLIIFAILSLIMSCGLLYFYLFSESGTSFNDADALANEKSSKNIKDHTQDIDITGVDIKDNNDHKGQPFDKIFNKDQNVRLNSTEQAPVPSVQEKQIQENNNKTNQLKDKSQKLSAKVNQGSVTVSKVTPSPLVMVIPKNSIKKPEKSSRVSPPYLAPVADDIDAIILLELDVAFKNDTPPRSAKSTAKL